MNTCVKGSKIFFILKVIISYPPKIIRTDRLNLNEQGHPKFQNYDVVASDPSAIQYSQ